MVDDAEYIKVVGMMAENELCVAELYRTYASKFPEAGKFWDDLAVEEEGHAKILTGFMDGLRNGSMVIHGRVYASSVKTLLSFVRQKLAQARENAMTLKDALLVADGLEGSILEEECFKVVDDDQGVMKERAVVLLRDTARHRAMIKDMLARQTG